MVVKSECKRSDESVKEEKMVVQCERKKSAVPQLVQNRTSTVRMHMRKTLSGGGRSVTDNKKGRGEKWKSKLLIQRSVFSWIVQCFSPPGVFHRQKSHLNGVSLKL